MHAIITNALIRCTRADRVAESAFELVNANRGLWVRELPEDIEAIVEDLSVIRPLLKELRIGGSDYTLHMAAAIDEYHSLFLPPALSELAGECGFAIELFACAFEELNRA